MADEGMRRTERLALSGDLDAQARLLLEKVRAGELAAERVRLLCLLEHPLAARALGEELPGSRRQPKQWALEIAPLGAEVMVRVAVAAARAVMRRDEDYSVQAIRAAEAWVLNQDATRARLAGNAAEAITNRRRMVDERLHSSVEAAEAAARVAQLATLTDSTLPSAMNDPRHWLTMCLANAERAIGVEEARKKLREEVEVWALGKGDPIAARRRSSFGVDDASVEGAPIPR